MRVIGGRYRGRRLTSFKADHIRPTTDRVKESLFNKWGFKIEGSRFLDLFCGTGSLGIEAISRGAEFCLFVDSHPKSVRILKSNLSLLQINHGFQIEKKDSLDFLAKYCGESFDLVTIDPPFTQVMADRVLEICARSSVLREGSLVAIETGVRESVKESYGSLVSYDIRSFGEKKLHLYQLKERP